MRDYSTNMLQYEKRLAQVVKETIKKESIKNELFRFGIGSRVKALLKEKNNLLELMKQTQKAYLQREVMDTRVYKVRMSSYSARIATIDEELALIEARKAFNRVRRLFYKIIRKDYLESLSNKKKNLKMRKKK
jgi:hypothetical protein